MLIEDKFYGKRLYLLLLGTNPDNIDDANWNLLDRLILWVIRLTLSRLVAHNIIKERITIDLIEAFFNMYEKPSINNKVHLMKLFNLRMVEDTLLTKYLNDFNTITNKKNCDQLGLSLIMRSECYSICIFVK